MAAGPLLIFSILYIKFIQPTKIPNPNHLFLPGFFLVKVGLTTCLSHIKHFHGQRGSFKCPTRVSFPMSTTFQFLHRKPLPTSWLEFLFQLKNFSGKKNCFHISRFRNINRWTHEEVEGGRACI